MLQLKFCFLKLENNFLIFSSRLSSLFSQKKNGWELKPDEIAGLMLKLQNESKCHNINFGKNHVFFKRSFTVYFYHYVFLVLTTFVVEVAF